VVIKLVIMRCQKRGDTSLVACHTSGGAWRRFHVLKCTRDLDEVLHDLGVPCRRTRRARTTTGRQTDTVPSCARVERRIVAHDLTLRAGLWYPCPFLKSASRGVPSERLGPCSAPGTDATASQTLTQSCHN
jgi:hypothetical protein